MPDLGGPPEVCHAAVVDVTDPQWGDTPLVEEHMTKASTRWAGTFVNSEKTETFFEH